MNKEKNKLIFGGIIVVILAFFMVYIYNSTSSSSSSDKTSSSSSNGGSVPSKTEKVGTSGSETKLDPTKKQEECQEQIDNRKRNTDIPCSTKTRDYVNKTEDKALEKNYQVPVTINPSPRKDIDSNTTENNSTQTNTIQKEYYHTANKTFLSSLVDFVTFTINITRSFVSFLREPGINRNIFIVVMVLFIPMEYKIMVLFMWSLKLYLEEKEKKEKEKEEKEKKEKEEKERLERRDRILIRLLDA